MKRNDVTCAANILSEGEEGPAISQKSTRSRCTEPPPRRSENKPPSCRNPGSFLHVETRWDVFFYSWVKNEFSTQSRWVLTFEVVCVNLDAADHSRVTQTKHGPLPTRDLQDPLLVHLQDDRQRHVRGCVCPHWQENTNKDRERERTTLTDSLLICESRN